MSNVESRMYNDYNNNLQFFDRIIKTTYYLPLSVLLGRGPSRLHGGSPWPEKSLNFRYEIVSLIMLALSNCEVIAAGKGSIFASSQNSKFSLPRLDLAASLLFSLRSSKILQRKQLVTTCQAPFKTYIYFYYQKNQYFGSVDSKNCGSNFFYYVVVRPLLY